MSTNKEDILAGLELALSTVIPAARNKWVSVKELSVVKLLQEASINKNYSSVFMEVLKDNGLVEVEGSCSGMRYRFSSRVVPDFSILASQIYEKFKTKYSSRSKSSDLKPLRCKSAEIEETSGKCISVKRKIVVPKIGDIVFVIYDNRIRQAYVLGTRITFNPSAPPRSSKKQLSIEVVIPLKKYSNSSELLKDCGSGFHPNLLTMEVELKDTFVSAEDAASYLVRSAFKFPKDYIKLFNNA